MDGECIAVITGGASAIGQAMARRLARLEAAVVAVRKGSVAEGILADLLDRAAPGGVMDEVARRLGRPDCLVNKAGLSGARRIWEVALGKWDAVLAVNLTAPMLLAQGAMRFWRTQRVGGIMNLASRIWLSGAGSGCTGSKVGLVGLTRSLAVQLGPSGVTVDAVAPGYVGSGFNFGGDPAAVQRAAAEHARLGVLGRVATPEDVAGAIAFLTSGDARFITGEVIRVAGGAQLAARPASEEVTRGQG